MPTTITISEFQLPDCNFLGTTCKLRRYYDQDWTDVDGVFHAEGSQNSSTSFFDEIACTLSGNTVTVPSFPATPTDNPQTGSNVRETWQLWDQSGSPRNVIFEGFIPSANPTITFGALKLLNAGQTLFESDAITRLDQWIQQYINTVIGVLRFATSVIAGWVRLSVPAANVVDPIALGDNDPRVPASTTGLFYASQYSSLALADAAAVSGTLVIDKNFTLSGNTTLNAARVMFLNGVITRGTNTLTFNGLIEADPYQQLFDAAGTGTVALTQNGDIPAGWFGADRTGAADSTNPIKQAVATVPLTGGRVLFGVGTYKTISEVLVSRGYIALLGAGSGKTSIRFAPTGNSTCLRISAGASQVPQFTLKGITLTSNDSTFTKTAIDYSDLTNGCIFDDVVITGPNITVTGGGATAPMWHDVNGTSIGIHTRGRDLTAFDNIRSWADRPVVVSANPNTARTDNEDLDQVNFNDLYLIGWKNYCVHVDDGIGLDNVSFTGYQSWAAGVGGFRMNDTRVSPNVPSQGLSFENVRYEQSANADAGLTQPSTGFGFSIIQTGGIDVSFKNCEVGSDSNGYDVRGVYQVNYTSIVAAQSATAGSDVCIRMTPVGGAQADIVTMTNCFWQHGSTFDMSQYIMVAGEFDTANYAGPSSATYSAKSIPYGIGIPGNTSPSTALHVYKNTDGSGQLRVQNPNAGASAETRLQLVSDAATSDFITQSIAAGQVVQWQAQNNVALVINQVAAAPLTFQTANIERMRIATGGNVTYSGAVNFGADAGSTDAYAITLSSVTAYVTGMTIVFTANTANTGACSVNINGLGAKALKRGVATDPPDNFIKAGSVVVAVYDGTNFQMIQPAAQ